MYYIGFDIGGSSVKAVLVQKKEIMGTRFERLPNNFNKLLDVIASIKDDFASAVGPKNIKGIGFSIAGALNKKRERMLLSYNIPYLNNKLLLPILKRRLEFQKIIIERDIPCFVVAEQTKGLAKKFKNVFYLTLGTGIGGSFTIEGKIILGSHGSAGEIGHTIVDFNKKTKWENIAANKYIRRKLKKPFTEAKQVALKGNKRTLQIFRELGGNLGIGIANIINIFDPEAVIISGGLAEARKFFLPEIKKKIKKFVISSEAQKTRILWSKLGRFGGALGAALLVQNSKIKNQNEKTKSKNI